MIPIGIIPVVIIVIYLLSSIKILREYERGVIFRLGRVLPQPKGPGLFLVFAPIDRMVRTSLRIEAMEVPAQDVITRDNVTVKVNAVVYFRVIDPTKAVIEVTRKICRKVRYAMKFLDDCYRRKLSMYIFAYNL